MPLYFRLAHDISPDNYPTDDLDDTDVVLQREKFLLDCLNQATTNINNNNSITHLTQTVCDQTCDKTEKITETFAKLKWKEEQLEKINNEINKNHLTKEDHNDHINFINNNYIQVTSIRMHSISTWMDDLRFVSFSKVFLSYQEKCKDDHERLCAMEPHCG